MDTGPEFEVEDVKPTRFPEVEMARRVLDAQERTKARKKDAAKRASKPRTRYRKRPNTEPHNPSSPYVGKGGSNPVGPGGGGGGPMGPL